MSNSIITAELIENRIYFIRNKKVMLDRDLAELYDVETRVLNQAVKRNIERFPNDFMFQLSDSEADMMVSQNVIPSKKYFGGHLPYVFTEQGVAMLSGVLNSDRAIQVNIAIMRVFVRLRGLIESNKELARKLNQLELKVERHDDEIKAIFDAIRQLMAPPEKPARKIGFKTEK